MNPSPLSFRRLIIVVSAMLMLCGCGDQADRRHSPPPWANISAAAVEGDGARFSAWAYNQAPQASALFGLDLPGAGLLPVLLAVENRSGEPIKLLPRQTFLVDQNQQAWPLLTAEQALRRMGKQETSPPHPPTAEEVSSFTAFAVALASGPKFLENLQAITPNERGKLRNPVIAAGQVASGGLFFPGRDEAKTVKFLRLSYDVAGQVKFIKLPLAGVAP